MKTKISLLFLCLWFLFSGIFNEINAQNNAGQGNFDMPIIIANVTEPSDCNTSDAIISITEPLDSNYLYSINGGAYQSSPHFMNLSPGQYSVIFIDNILGCSSKEKIVDIPPVPCDLHPDILCDVFTDLQGLILTETSFIMVMSDKISDILTSLQLSNGSVVNILSQIKSLDLQLSYNTAQGSGDNIYNIYNTSMYGDLSTFRIKSLAIEISGISTINFSGKYQLIITLQNDEVLKCNEYPLILTTETIDDGIPEEIEGLPLLSCNSTLDEEPDNTELLPEASIGELFYIKEFPILLTDVYPSSGGIYSGRGILPLPFGSRYILVEFSSVQVTKTRKIKGTVRAISGSPVACSAPSVDFGGPICIPPLPPSSFSGPGGTDIDGYDSYGFDPITRTYKDGSLYDPNGFDYDGNYQDSEPPSPFNPQGCNRDGVDINGNECDPSPYPPNPEVVKFIEDNEVGFELALDSLLRQLKQEYSLKLQSLNCEVFRNNMNADLSNYTEVSVVKGSNDQYYELGLSSNFDTEIPTSEYDDSRLNPNIKAIQSNHAKLYDCDLLSIKYNKIISRIITILEDETLQEQILEDIKNIIINWSAEEMTIYGEGGVSSQAFTDWMKEQLKEIIMELEGDKTLFSLIQKNKSSKQPFRVHPIENSIPYIDYYNSMASIDKEFGGKLTSSEKEEIAFYLANGFNSIKGRDRVHYLDAMTQSVSSNGTATPNVMPLKLSSSAGSMIYTMFLDQFEFTETSAQFDACIKIEDAESGKILVFRAQNIAFGPGGTTEPFRLELVNDEVSLRINNAAKLHLFKESTFVEFNCQGFVRAGLEADVEFCPEYILPIDSEGQVIENKNYKIHIPQITMNKWMEFIVEMDAPPFAMTKYENIQWEVSKMIIDTDSGAGANVQITPPEGYESTINPNSVSWKGFYVESLKVKFLSELPAAGNNPVEIDVQGLIIDGTGVSAYAEVNADILNNGNMSGWPLSINKVSLLVLHNNVSGFGFGGDIKLPVFNESLDYNAEVYSSGKYKFSVSLADHLTCPLFKANAQINDDSEVTVIYDGSKFIATARLNGELKIGNDLISGTSGVFPTIAFTGMQVST